MTKILIVDDAPEIEVLMEDILKPLGYEVEAAASADAAWEKIRRARPELILLDIMMTGKNGFDFCRELKNTAFRDIPVIIVSVKRDKADIEKGKQVGADDYVTKPFDPDDLVNKIQKLLHA
jgi:DNA-binding response OmpR family regulator